MLLLTGKFSGCRLSLQGLGLCIHRKLGIHVPVVASLLHANEGAAAHAENDAESCDHADVLADAGPGSFGIAGRVQGQPCRQPDEGAAGCVVPDMPKTRSGKIMRRVLASISNMMDIGDVTTLANPEIVEEVRRMVQGDAPIATQQGPEDIARFGKE